MHFAGKKLAKESEHDVLLQCAQWVREQVEAKKTTLLLEKEDAEWKWSILFRAFCKLPACPTGTVDKCLFIPRKSYNTSFVGYWKNSFYYSRLHLFLRRCFL